MTRRLPTGADLVVAALEAAGVRNVFTVSGNHVLSLYDATIGRPIRLVHTRHEAAAVHMADAWGRLTDTPGVALVTAGPGHANALGALYGALLSESPVVLLSGHSPLGELGQGSFQEMDQVAAARPVTKAAWRSDVPARLGDDVRSALELAASGRPGPVSLSLPGDVLEAKAGEVAVRAPRAVTEARMSAADVDSVLDVLGEAARPLIVAGAAASRTARWAAACELAVATGIPAVPLESPRGVNDPALRGGARALGEADVVLLLGKSLDFSLRFGQPPAFAPGCRFISIAAELLPALQARRLERAIVAEPGVAAATLARAAGKRPRRSTGWRAEVERACTVRPDAWPTLASSAAVPMHPLAVAAAVTPLVEAGALFVCDGGEFGQWMQAAVAPRARLINGLSGSIGSALPMAIAAKLAEPSGPVLVALGDGTFGYHGFELDTALRYGLPIIAIVGNDARWNAEHQLQLRHYGTERVIGCDLLPSRYDGVAAALGGYGEVVERPEDLRPTLDRAIASGRPACVNVRIASVAAPVFR
jgi:acetolactate synthase-1/2/3 large subunit